MCRNTEKNREIAIKKDLFGVFQGEFNLCGRNNGLSGISLTFNSFEIFCIVELFVIFFYIL